MLFYLYLEQYSQGNQKSDRNNIHWYFIIRPLSDTYNLYTHIYICLRFVNFFIVRSLYPYHSSISYTLLTINQIELFKCLCVFHRTDSRTYYYSLQYILIHIQIKFKLQTSVPFTEIPSHKFYIFSLLRYYTLLSPISISVILLFFYSSQCKCRECQDLRSLTSPSSVLLLWSITHPPVVKSIHPIGFSLIDIAIILFHSFFWNVLELRFWNQPKKIIHFSHKN